jgi:hypothetical protein
MIGPAKQANILVIFTKHDKNFKYALERAWIGGKKNDIVVIFGIIKYPTVDYVDVFTFANSTGNERFRVILRDNITQATATGFDVNTVTNIISTDVNKYFVRYQMENFVYLQDEISIPTAALVSMLFITFVSGILLFVNFRGN